MIPLTFHIHLSIYFIQKNYTNIINFVVACSITKQKYNLDLYFTHLY